MSDQPIRDQLREARINSTLDVLTACKFCYHNLGEIIPGVVVAPQFTGGDVDKPVTYEIVCEGHFCDWWEDVEPEFRLPAFRLHPSIAYKSPGSSNWVVTPLDGDSLQVRIDRGDFTLREDYLDA